MLLLLLLLLPYLKVTSSPSVAVSSVLLLGSGEVRCWLWCSPTTYQRDYLIKDQRKND